MASFMLSLQPGKRKLPSLRDFFRKCLCPSTVLLQTQIFESLDLKVVMYGSKVEVVGQDSFQLQSKWNEVLTRCRPPNPCPKNKKDNTFDLLSIPWTSQSQMYRLLFETPPSPILPGSNGHWNLRQSLPAKVWAQGS